AQFYTRLGTPPEGDLTAQVARMIVRKKLEQEHITFIDATQGVNAVAFNQVAEHDKGRMIIKNNVPKAKALTQNILAEINSSVSRSLLTFIDPRKPTIGAFAAEASTQHKTLSATDYGDKQWPDIPELAEKYDTIFKNVDIIFVPDDAIIKGMKKENPDALINGLYEQYETPYILMSNGGHDATAMVNGKSYTIPVADYDGVKYTLAAGDTRNAGFALSLVLLHQSGELEDDPDRAMLKAFKMASVIATEKIKKPGRQFVEGLYDVLERHELFHQYLSFAELSTPSIGKKFNEGLYPSS
ncbi:MAG: PfkB family carbohydrate kinase, partial [Pseudomonadota bacterium]